MRPIFLIRHILIIVALHNFAAIFIIFAANTEKDAISLYTCLLRNSKKLNQI